MTAVTIDRPPTLTGEGEGEGEECVGGWLPSGECNQTATQEVLLACEHTQWRAALCDDHFKEAYQYTRPESSARLSCGRLHDVHIVTVMPL